MKCPNCGTKERALVKVCRSCGEAFASQDLLELHQLQFLVEETAGWGVPNALRTPYRERLEKLQDRLLRRGAPEPEAEVVKERAPAVKEVTTPTPTPALKPAAVEAAPPAAVKMPKAAPVKPKPKPKEPPKEAVPFDQWLLSERNIKIALYSGGLLLVVAGLIFIGVNWTRIPGPVKFAITLMITGLMYLGGYLLFQRPAYRIGGVALLGVASGFLTLNFAVLQIYVLGPSGLRDDMMWLIASPLCLLLYALTAYWTKGDLFTYLSLAAVGSTVTAALVVTEAPMLIFILAYALLAFAIWFLSYALKETSAADFTHMPLLIVAHTVMPLTFLASFTILLSEAHCTVCTAGSPWLSLLTMVLGTTFYMLNAFQSRSQLFTYISMAGIYSVAFGVLFLINAPMLAHPLVYSVLALVTLLVSRALKSIPQSDFTHMPLEIVSHIVVPLTFLGSFSLVVSEVVCPTCTSGNPWLSLLTMCLGTVFYMLNAFWRRNQLFTYISLAGVYCIAFGALLLINVPILVHPLVYALMALATLLVSRALKSTPLVDFTQIPLLVTAHLVIPGTIFAALLGWSFNSYIDENPWLALASLGIGVLFYAATDGLFKYLAARWAAATLLPVTLALVMMELEFSDSAMAITLMVLALLYLGVGYLLERREGRRAGGWPLYVVAYAVACLVTVMAIPETEDLVQVLFGDVILVAVSAAIHRDYRWVYGAVWLFMLPVYLLISLFVPVFYHQGLLMGALGLVYGAVGYMLGREELRLGGPFLTAAAFLSIVTVALTWENPLVASLVLAALAGIYLLVVFWMDNPWLIAPVYISVWLLMLSAYLLVDQYVAEPHYQGLLMGVLGLNYCIIGYVLGRRKLWLGGPFLSAAVALSVVVVALTWSSPVVASLTLAVIAALYLLAALWLDWSWLLFPTLLAVNLAVLSINNIFFTQLSTLQYTLPTSYFTLGGALALVGLGLRRAREDRWALPLYLVGALDLAGAYTASLLVGGWLAVGISAVFAALLLSFAWLERQELEKLKVPPLLTYIGIGAIFAGHFYLIDLAAGRFSGDIWPGITAGLCALFVILAWVIRGEQFVKLYGTPFRLAGLCLMAIPLFGSLYILEPILIAATFAIAGVTFLADGVMRRILNLAYLGIGAFLIVVWSTLLALEIYELQAYVIPLGVTLQGVAWYERWKMEGRLYRILSMVSLITLLGSAFYQSVIQDAVGYAALLLVESLLFIALGIQSRSRCYVQLGGLALIANAIVQLGPGFVELPRWIQIGVTGGILLGGGLAALFKKEEILTGSQKLTDDWRQWNP